MKKDILLSILALTVFTISYGQKTEKSYEPAYVINTNSLERIAKESELRTQTPEVQIFLFNYPILNDLTEFSKRKTYAMINTVLINSIEDTKKYRIFHFKNNKTYKVKKSIRCDRSISRSR